MVLDNAKKKATEFALDKAVKYLHKNPEKNLFKILDYMKSVAIEPYHKLWIDDLKNYFSRTPAALEQAKRVCGNERMLYNLINSWGLHGGFWGKPKRNKAAEELGVSIPAAILIDPTSACNLRCEGCWAGEYSKNDIIEPELFSRIVAEAKELGIHWIALSGGEPFCYPHLTQVLEEHPDSFFMAYTNGTLIDEKMADKLAELGNLTPAFSLEGGRDYTDSRRGKGTYDKVMHAMDLLRERGVLFGASVTAMSNNLEELFSDSFMEHLINKGVTYIWSFHYVPIGSDPDVNLMLTPEQRKWMINRVDEIRAEKPVLLVDFWNDGGYTEGCIAGGREYFHINAAGDVEPCAFVHFAVDNIRDKSLREVLLNPFFKAYQQEMPFCENHLAPCPIIDNPEKLKDMIDRCNAQPTHEGADNVFRDEIANHLHKSSSKWKETITKEEVKKEKIKQYS